MMKATRFVLRQTDSITDNNNIKSSKPHDYLAIFHMCITEMLMNISILE